MRPIPSRASRAIDVIGLGQNSIDHVCRVKTFPPVGSKTDALSYHMLPGGQVATAVLQAHRLGLRTCYVGAVGDDELAAPALAVLRAEGVRLEVKEVAGARTQFALIVVDDSGERTIVESYDPRTIITEKDLDGALFATTRILHLDITDVPAAIRAARTTREAGGLVSLDIDRLLPGTPDLLGLVDLLVASENLPNELGSPNPTLALHTLRNLCPGFVCITSGERGSVALDGEDAIFTPAFEVEVVDTTGCGDAFRGSFLYGVLEGLPTREALRLASGAAALQAMSLGAQSGVPTLERVRSFLSLESARPKGKSMSDEEKQDTVSKGEAAEAQPRMDGSLRIYPPQDGPLAKTLADSSRAFARGDFGRARSLAQDAIARSPSPAEKSFAEEILRRTSVDPVALAAGVGSFLVFWLTLWLTLVK